MKRFVLALLLLTALLCPVAAIAQPVTVIGPITPGDCAAFFSTTQIKDAGGICGSGGGGSPGGSNGQVQFNNFGTFGGLTNTQLTADINLATASLSGALPAWPNNTTTFFRGDGTYAVPSGSSGANPSASVGLSAVPGSATTFLRSDGAPPLSQSITPTWTGTHIHSADDYFGSGRPWCDVRANGAVGNGSTDDSAAFQSCVTTLNALTGGIIYIPPGNYCLKTAQANSAVMSITSKNISLQGAGINVSNLWTCGVDVSLVYANVVGVNIKDLSYLAKGGQGNPNETTFGASTPAFKFDSACGLCAIHNVRGFGGSFALNDNGFDSFIDNFSFGYTYSYAILLMTADGVRVSNGALDQNWPVVVPNNNSLTINAWAATHAYSGNTASTTQVVSTQGYNIQLVSASCTSGSSAPTLQNYGTAITDGTCSWQLVGATVYIGLDCDGGCQEVFGRDLDISCGGCTYGIAMTDINAGTAPSVMTITGGTSIGVQVTANVGLLSGSGFTITDAHMSGAVASGGFVIESVSPFSGDVTISNTRQASTGFCTAIGIAPTSAGYAINGNRFIGCSQAVLFFAVAAAAHVTAGNNTMRNVTTGFNMPAGSSFYEFTNNDTNGAALTFTAGDANKTVTGNN